MRKARFILLLPLFFSIGLRSGAEDSQKAPPAKGPHIVIDPAQFDFGRAVQNKTLNTEFVIRNFGSEDLTIERVSTTCGCTAALVADRVVKPGGSTRLRVSLETRTYSGKVERTVLVRSNDPATSVAEAKVLATVVPPDGK